MAVKNTNTSDTTNYARLTKAVALLNPHANSHGTLCLWAQKTANSSQTQVIVQLYDSSAGNYAIQVSTDNTTLQLYPNTTAVTLKASLPSSTWFFVALTWVGAALTAYYTEVAGAITTSVTATSGGTWHGNPTTTKLSLFDSAGATRSFWPGLIDNVKTWNRALTRSELEIESVYRRPFRTEGLNTWFPLEGGSITTALVDASGRGKNLTYSTAGSGTLTYDGSISR